MKKSGFRKCYLYFKYTTLKIHTIEELFLLHVCLAILNSITASYDLHFKQQVWIFFREYVYNTVKYQDQQLILLFAL